MINSLIAKIKGFLLAPVKTFQQTRDDEPKEVFTYFALLVLIYSILSAIIAVIKIDSTFGGAVTGTEAIFFVFFGELIGRFIITFIYTLIFATLLHLWVYIFGGRNGIMQTIKAVIYGRTPEFLLGWIPVIGPLFFIWALVLGVLGVSELQEINTAKAFVVFVITMIILLIGLVLMFWHAHYY